jgi:hypothetical protein
MHTDISLIEIDTGERHLGSTLENPRVIYLGLIDGQPCVRSSSKPEALRKLLRLAGIGVLVCLVVIRR